jgi:hypothetical protein
MVMISMMMAKAHNPTPAAVLHERYARRALTAPRQTCTDCQALAAAAVQMDDDRTRSYSAFALPVEASLMGPPTPHTSEPKALSVVHLCFADIRARAFIPKCTHVINM